MAAQKMPLGHKRRGEATRAYDPRHQITRKRYYNAIVKNRTPVATTAEIAPRMVNSAGMQARSFRGLP